MNPTRHLSIFLVDDDPMFMTTLGNRLEQKFNAHISKFSTGEECLKHLHQNPGIIVLDYFLNSSSPDAMNGIRILEKIKLVSPETNVIIVSAQDKINIALAAIKSGALDYIIKNENTFLRIQNAIKNAMNKMELAKELKNDRAKVKLFAALILVVAIMVFVVDKYYPQLFNI